MDSVYYTGKKMKRSAFTMFLYSLGECAFITSLLAVAISFISIATLEDVELSSFAGFVALFVVWFLATVIYVGIAALIIFIIRLIVTATYNSKHTDASATLLAKIASSRNVFANGTVKARLNVPYNVTKHGTLFLTEKALEFYETNDTTSKIGVHINLSGIKSVKTGFGIFTKNKLIVVTSQKTYKFKTLPCAAGKWKRQIKKAIK